MLNSITIAGRLTRDPELRRTPAGDAVTSFCVAVDRDYTPKDGGERQCDFIDCIAWKSRGEFVSRYFQKGSMIIVAGRLQIRNWTDKDGNKRKSAEVVADAVYFGGSKNTSQPEKPASAAPSPSGSDFEVMDDFDAELPF